jgi:hypothetical protein
MATYRVMRATPVLRPFKDFEIGSEITITPTKIHRMMLIDDLVCKTDAVGRFEVLELVDGGAAMIVGHLSDDRTKEEPDDTETAESDRGEQTEATPDPEHDDAGDGGAPESELPDAD